MKKYSKDEYDSMSTAQHQQLYELWKKARIIKGKKTPESSRALEARVAPLKANKENSSNESLFTDKMKSPKRIIEATQPLKEREVAPGRAMQIVEG